jgi:hypothetical protein
MPFNFKELEALLVCPESRSKLIQDGDWLVCVNPECRLKYPIRDEIPVMLIDQAIRLDPPEWADLIQRHSRDRSTGRPEGDS